MATKEDILEQIVGEYLVRLNTERPTEWCCVCIEKKVREIRL